MIFETESVMTQKTFWVFFVSVVVGLITGTCGIKETIPTIVKFDHRDWTKLPDGSLRLIIPSERHGKGNWPTYKLVEDSGEAFIAGKERVKLNGDIEIDIVAADDRGITGRAFIK